MFPVVESLGIVPKSLEVWRWGGGKIVESLSLIYDTQTLSS